MRLVLLLSFISVYISAQLSLDKFNPVVLNGSDSLNLAWSGGLNAPQFSQIDLNQDGILDLFLFERNWEGRAKTFLSVNGSYEYAPEYLSKFPEIRNWAALKDYNCDGKMDVFCWSPTGAGVAIYKNESTVQDGLIFSLVKELVYTQGMSGEVNLYVSSVDYPAIIDVDDDGDLDVLTFGIGGSLIEYHRNYAIEDHGTCDSIDFRLEDSCWGLFSEDGLTNDLVLDISCKGPQMEGEGERHTGSAICVLDTDGDADKDILLGDISYANLVFARNGGDLSFAHMDTFMTQYPENTVPVNIELFPLAFHIDIDHDGDKDLCAAANSPGFSRDVSNVWYYENEGSDLAPDFQFVKSDFLQGEMIDIGTGAHPNIIDVNGDGLNDILIFNEYKFSNSGLFSNLVYFKNIGSLTDPKFQLEDEDFLNFSENELKGVHATFGDLDDDGDLDMIIGDGDGKIHWFTNTAGSGNLINLQLMAFNYNAIDVGGYSAPFLFDLSGDGLLDLTIGEKGGTVNYIPNTGSLTNAVFAIQNLQVDFGGIDVEIPCCTGYSIPLIRKDSLDEIELYLGSESGAIYRYKGLDDSLTGNFILQDSLLTYSFRVSPTIGELTNDNKEEWLIGENYGGLQLFSETVDLVDNIKEFQELELNVFPNPTKASIGISGLSNNETYTFEIFDVQGRRVLMEVAIVIDKYILNLSSLKPGIYFVQINSNNSRGTVKVMKE